MPISLSDTVEPAGDFPISFGKDIQGAITASAVSSSGQLFAALIVTGKLIGILTN